MSRLPEWKDRYKQAHESWQWVKYPGVCESFGTTSPNWPDTRKSNGLTRFIINFLNWTGHNATRITSSGRQIQVKGGTKWIPGTTRRGRADIDSTIRVNNIGRPVKWEIKCGEDTPSEYQLAEQIREQQAGGFYFFTHSPEEFFEQYDSLFVSSENKQAMQ